MPIQKSGELAVWIGSLLLTHVRPYKLGRVGIESHDFSDDQAHTRFPDVWFITDQRSERVQGILQLPDLAIEIKLPSDSHKELRTRAQYYLANGSRLVWIFDYVKRLVIGITADDEFILVDGDTLTGGDVLPDFSVQVSEIFEDTLDDH